MSRFSRLFAGKNVVVYIIIAFSFWWLIQYRNNDPLPPATTIPNFAFTTMDNQTFTLNQVNIPVALIFFGKPSVFSNRIYPEVYLRMLPELMLLEQQNYLKIIVVTNTEQTFEAVHAAFSKRKYKILDNLVHLAKIRTIQDFFGVRSWPHFFLVSPDNTLLYEAKIPSAETVSRIVKGG